MLANFMRTVHLWHINFHIARVFKVWKTGQPNEWMANVGSSSIYVLKNSGSVINWLHLGHFSSSKNQKPIGCWEGFFFFFSLVFLSVCHLLCGYCLQRDRVEKPLFFRSCVLNFWLMIVNWCWEPIEYSSRTLYGMDKRIRCRYIYVRWSRDVMVIPLDRP